MRYWLHVHICIFWPKDEYRGMSGWYARIDSLHRDNYSDVNPHPFPASLPQPLLSTHLQAAIPSTFQFFCHFSPFTLLNSSWLFSKLTVQKTDGLWKLEIISRHLSRLDNNKIVSQEWGRGGGVQWIEMRGGIMHEKNIWYPPL